MKITFKQGELHAMALDEDTVALVMAREQAQQLYDLLRKLSYSQTTDDTRLIARALHGLDSIQKAGP